MSLNILFLRPPVHAGAFGGAHVHFTQLARHLQQLGHNIGILHPESIEDNYRWFPDTSMGLLRGSLWAHVLYQRLDATSAYPGWMGRALHAARRVRRLPVAWEVNAPIAETAILRQISDIELRRRESYAREAAGTVDIAFCVSEEMSAYAQRDLGIMDVRYVPNGADIERMTPNVQPSEEVKSDSSAPVIFWMGSGALPWEGDRIILDLAIHLYREKIPAKVILCGAQRSDMPDLPPNTSHLGRVSYTALPSYVAGADICLCLYDLTAYGAAGFYGSPVKLYEYMAAGKAVIATDVGEIQRSVTHEKDGLLVGSDRVQIYDAVKRLIADRAFRQSLGAAARQKAETFYNWNRAAEQTAAALQLHVAKRQDRTSRDALSSLVASGRNSSQPAP